MRRQTTLPALALPALLLAACSEGSADAAATAEIDTVGGRVEVANTGTPIWTAETAWRLEEDLRLGTLGDTGSEPERFAQGPGELSDVPYVSRLRIEWGR